MSTLMHAAARLISIHVCEGVEVHATKKDRMSRAMVASGRRVPVIEDRGDHVAVTFAGQAPNKRVAEFVRGLPDEEQNDTGALLVLHVLWLRHDVLAALGPAVVYRRRDTTKIAGKVIDHLREYGDISNATLQRLFDLDVYQARDILRDLVEREIFVRTSEQSRGPAVCYGTGQRFPRGRGPRG